MVADEVSHGHRLGQPLQGASAKTMRQLGYSIEEVLTIGQKDILENWSVYRDRFVKEMKK